MLFGRRRAALKAAHDVLTHGAGSKWTLERIAQLSVPDIRQLRENAERLNNAAVAGLCTEALSVAPAVARAARSRLRSTIKPRRLIARAKAFAARGVWLEDPGKSWGGVRKSDGSVVLALWADAIESADGGCSYLLWAPNVKGSRAWSDQPAGRERLAHCKQAMQLGRAEGLLVYGECCAGHIPEDKAYTVLGVDPETVVIFQVEMRGAEFWATWGRKGRASFAAASD